jgi:hypothetical protein
MKNLPGVKFGTTLKNKWGKNEITQYYTPVAGEWSQRHKLYIGKIEQYAVSPK